LSSPANLQLRMNSGELIMFDIRPELNRLLQCRSPATKKEIRMAFVAFCDKHDLIDLVFNTYCISKHKELHALLKVD
jgi:hypothetical protein